MKEDTNKPKEINIEFSIEINDDEDTASRRRRKKQGKQSSLTAFWIFLATLGLVSSVILFVAFIAFLCLGMNPQACYCFVAAFAAFGIFFIIGMSLASSKLANASGHMPWWYGAV